MSGKSASASDLRNFGLFSKPDRFISTFASHKTNVTDEKPSSGIFQRNNTTPAASTSTKKNGNLKKGLTTDGNTPSVKPTMAQAASNVYARMAQAMDERTEKVQEASDETERLMNSAQKFQQTSARLLEREKQKKWWEW